MNEFYILDRKEIEDYLIDPIAISRLAQRPIDEINEIIDSASDAGKEKLDWIFKQIYLKLDSGTKETLVRNMDKIPDEIIIFLNSVKEIARKRYTSRLIL